MSNHDPVDDRLVRILAASRAAADPAVLQRARARLGGLAQMPGPLAWLGTPAALAAACALFIAVAGVSVALVRSDSSNPRETTLVSALIGDDGSYGLPTAATSSATGTGVADSGTVAP